MKKYFLNNRNLDTIVTIVLRYRVTVVVLFSLGLVVSLLEAIGVTLIFPLLEGMPGTQGESLLAPFSCLYQSFSGMAIKPRIQFVALAMVLIIGLKSWSGYVYRVRGNWLQQEAAKYYRKACFDQLMRFNIGYFNRQRFGDVASLIITNSGYIGSFINNLNDLFPRLITVGFLIYVLFILSWQMSLTAIVFVMISSFFLWHIGDHARSAGMATDESYKKMNSSLLDALMGMKIIRLFNREKYISNKFYVDLNDCRNSEYAMNRLKLLISPAFEFSGVVILAIIMLMGSFVLTKNNDAYLQILLMFMVVLFRIIPHVNQINSLRVTLITNWPFLERVRLFIEERDEVYLVNGKSAFERLKREIEFRGVDFSYDHKESFILKNICLTVPKGVKAGIVGPSGGGKSTIIELFLRFYDPTVGQILVDGTDIREFDWCSWRRHIGVVSQDTFLFNDSLRANIAFAHADTSQREIEQAASRAHIHDFILTLPRGYDTMVGERGVRLSGGQRQRIAIARAILLEPEILVFDEATSSLDTHSEKLVQEALDDISVNKTVITIAHRLSTVMNSDIIFVIQAGKIAQKGTHDQLVNQDGIYHELVRMQNLNP